MPNMTLKLKVWRQDGPDTAGRLVEYTAEHISPDMLVAAIVVVLALVIWAVR